MVCAGPKVMPASSSASDMVVEECFINSLLSSVCKSSLFRIANLIVKNRSSSKISGLPMASHNLGNSRSVLMIASTI